MARKILLNTLLDIILMLFYGTMYFRVNNQQLFEKYIKIWEKVVKLTRIDFESKPVYGDDDDKYIKIYAGSKVTNFHNIKIPKENGPCKCLSVIMLDSAIKVN